MESETGALLTRWAVRLAVACYYVRVVADLRGAGNRNRRRRVARIAWSVGCALYVVHVLLAFAVFHDWSHQDAYRDTAEQTADLTGLRWGGGLYVNYAFSFLWLTDVALWWCRGLDAPYRSRLYPGVLHTVFGFIVFNATVVFGPPLWRWLAPIAASGLILAWRARRRDSGQPPGPCGRWRNHRPQRSGGRTGRDGDQSRRHA